MVLYLTNLVLAAVRRIKEGPVAELPMQPSDPEPWKRFGLNPKRVNLGRDSVDLYCVEIHLQHPAGLDLVVRCRCDGEANARCPLRAVG